MGSIEDFGGLNIFSLLWQKSLHDTELCFFRHLLSCCFLDIEFVLVEASVTVHYYEAAPFWHFGIAAHLFLYQLFYLCIYFNVWS